MKKYLLSIICTLLPIFASAQEPYAVMIDGNTAIEFRYDNEKAARGGMDIGPFSSEEDRPWNSMKDNIYSVVFDASFANYTSLTSTAYWFYECSNLETIIGIENLNTSNVTNMKLLFYNCSGLTSLDVSNFNTSNVTSMAALFEGCSGLTNLDVSNFNTSNVTNMGNMFLGCSGLTSLDLSNFNTPNVTEMACMFWFCSGLTSLDVSNFNTSNVTDVYGMFLGCSGLTSLDISNFNTSNVTRMSSMFSSCHNLRTIYVGDGWTTANVTEGDYMFSSCMSLVGGAGTTYNEDHEDASYAHIDGGASNPGYLTAGSGSGGGGSDEEAQYWMELQSMLQYANDVYSRSQGNANVEPWMQEELYYQIERGNEIYNHHEADEEEVRHMIEELNWICWEIEEAMNRQPEPSEGPVPYAVLSDNNTVLTFYYDDQKSARGGMEIYPTEPEVPWDNYRESVYSVVFNESFANCTSITRTDYWFSAFKRLETISGLDFLNTSNVIYMESMFSDCSSLTSLNINSFNTENVTNMNNMFFGCSSLTSLDLSNFKTDNVTDMGGLFMECTNLSNLDLSGFNTNQVTNMVAMFYHCSNLTTIYVGSAWSTASVTGSNDMFFDCPSLVGGRGTQWNEEHTDGEYAHIDGGVDNPGYLTDKNGGEGEARFDGLTAWVYGDATLDDAFAEVGREEALKTIAAIVWEGDGALTADQMQGITNPNLLVYVNEASKAPAGVQNIIVNGSAAQIVLTDASGNNNFHCPQSFTAQSISYTRNFSQTTEIGVCRGWETIALPFNVQSISHSHGALVPFGGGNGGYPFWLHQLQDNSLSPVTVMEANTPYLICMPNNKVYPSAYNQAGNVTFASSNVTVPETHPHEGFAGNVMLIPAFQSVEASPDIYTLNVGEASGSYAEGSVFISNYRSVRPFQAYTVHTNGARGEDIRYIPLTTLGGGTDGTTGIMEILQPVGNDAGAWYSLDGRKLDAKPTRKGVYIQNGKKIVIK